MTDDESYFGGRSVVPEVKADLILSIRDSMRQRGLGVDEAAAIAGIGAACLRAIVEGRRVQNVTAETLDRIFASIDAGPSGRRP